MVSFDVPYMEILIAKACNLHCDGCQNYTNYGLKGLVDFESTAEDIRRWGARVKPRMFRILGGEPMLHPSLADFIRVAHEVWPEARRVLVTNGMLAERRGDIVSALRETDTIVEVSIHSNDPKYLDRMRPALHVIKQWAADGCRIDLGDSRDFIRTYKGVGRNMRPFNDDPVGAWNICTARNCLNILDSRLWKCPTVSMLDDVLRKFALQDHPEWDPYTYYKGIGLDADDDELREFLGRGPEKICGICPSYRPTYQKDVFNLNFAHEGEKVAVNFPRVDLHEFMASC